jgi:hypothetical protein
MAWDNPEDLGEEIEIVLDDELYAIDTTCSVFIPAGVKHKIKVTRFTRPFVNIGLSLEVDMIEGYSDWMSGVR